MIRPLNLGPGTIASNREGRTRRKGRIEHDRRLQVLVATEAPERLTVLVSLTTGFGHRVVAAITDIDSVAEVTAEETPDVALIGLGDSSPRALSSIAAIVGQSGCPVIAVLPAPDPEFVREAARRRVFAYIDDARPESLPSSLELVLLRFAEDHGREEAFARRALIEQAKGILMGRHGVDAPAAFEAMRAHSRRHELRLTDVARDVVEGRLSLPAQP